MSKIHLCPLLSSHHRTEDRCGDSICGCSHCCTLGTTVQPHCWTKEPPRLLFPRQQCSVSYGSRNTPLRLSFAETIRAPHTVQPHSRTTGIVESSFLTYLFFTSFFSPFMPNIVRWTVSVPLFMGVSMLPNGSEKTCPSDLSVRHIEIHLGKLP